MITGSVKRAVSITVLGFALCLFATNWVVADSKNSINNQDNKAAEPEKPAEEVYKNIQVFNGLPASQLDGAMQFMSASLGVGCDHCHTNSWESDTKTAKLATRRMVLMTRNINKENFGNNPAVTCYSCHYGRPHSIPLPGAELIRPKADAEPAIAKPDSMPTTDEVIDRYIRAIGGQTAIEKLKTRVSRGNLTTENRMTAPVTAPVEVYQQAPNKILTIVNGQSYKGFNGASGWVKDNRGQRPVEGEDLIEQRREADFFKYLKLRESYPGLRVLGKENIGDREAYVVGATSLDGSREKLYFDVGTGLLTRRYTAFKTAFGTIPEVTDFDDYKEVSGAKLPFKIIWSRPPFASTRRFTEIKINVPVDDAKFEMPR
jgi:hypothetical protein